MRVNSLYILTLSYSVIIGVFHEFPGFDDYVETYMQQYSSQSIYRQWSRATLNVK